LPNQLRPLRSGQGLNSVLAGSAAEDCHKYNADPE
jgi:hypothetical protein